ncbi:MAG: putative damage-inducible protein DinB [Rhodothermales bacterium]|jgi:uncharacterized damage-inducible protein DinB
MNKDLLLELLTHMEWADRKVLAAAAATGDAPPDEYLLKTLLHIHFTQFAFLGAWRGDTIDWKSLKAIKTFEALAAWSSSNYGPIRDTLESRPDLSAPMVLTWANHFAKKVLDQPEAGVTSIGETFYQVVAHSNYHRAQANRRIRELDVEPPGVDYIIWVWAGRP